MNWNAYLQDHSKRKWRFLLEIELEISKTNVKDKWTQQPTREVDWLSEVEDDEYTSSALEIKLAAFDNTVLPAKLQRNDFECIQDELKQHNERIKILEKGIHMLVDKLKTNQ